MKLLGNRRIGYPFAILLSPFQARISQSLKAWEDSIGSLVPDTIFCGSKLLGNRRIGYPFAILLSPLQARISQSLKAWEDSIENLVPDPIFC